MTTNRKRMVYKCIRLFNLRKNFASYNLWAKNWRHFFYSLLPSPREFLAASPRRCRSFPIKSHYCGEKLKGARLFFNQPNNLAKSDTVPHARLSHQTNNNRPRGRCRVGRWNGVEKGLRPLNLIHPFSWKNGQKKKNTYQNPKVYYERISISTHSLKSAFLIEIKQSIDNMARWWSSHD